MILMLNPDSGDEQRDKIAGDVKSKLESSGEVLHEAKWGLRKMAYEIDKHESSDYRFYRFNGDKPLLDDLDHSLKITDGVLRFRIFKTEPDAPIMVPPDTEQIMRRDEDDRDRGRGRGGDRGDRGPRRPRYEDEGSGESSAPAAPRLRQPSPRHRAAEAPAAEAPADCPRRRRRGSGRGARRARRGSGHRGRADRGRLLRRRVARSPIPLFRSLRLDSATGRISRVRGCLDSEES